MQRIEIVNVRGLEVNASSVVYIGRAFAGWKGSVLGNPFQIGKDGSREEVIQMYRRWLWFRMQEQGQVQKEILRLAAMYARGESIKLGCWCFPQACHGEIVARAIRYYGYFKYSAKPRSTPRAQPKPRWMLKFQIVKGGDPHS